MASFRQTPGAVGGEFCSSLLLSLILPYLYMHRYAEYMEMNALSGAQSLARQAELLFLQAQGLSPLVRPVGEFVVPFEGLVRYPASCRYFLMLEYRFFLSNVVFDNLYTDLAFRSAAFSSIYTTGISVLILIRF